MAKAINWPLAYRDEVLNEDTTALRCAFRLGTLYYDGRFWAPGEVVDIRVNHLKVRKGVIEGDLEKYRLGDLPEALLRQQKTGLKTVAEVMAYLQKTYGEPVDENSWVTVVRYKNLPVVEEEIELQSSDPHM